MRNKKLSFLFYAASVFLMSFLEPMAVGAVFPNTDTSHQFSSSNSAASFSITTTREEELLTSRSFENKKKDLPLVQIERVEQRILKSESKSGRVSKSSKVSSKSKASSSTNNSFSKSSKSKTSSKKSSVQKSRKSSKANPSPSKKSRKSQISPTSAPVRTATSTPTSAPVLSSPAALRRAKLWSQLGNVDLPGYDSRYLFSPNSTTFVVGYRNYDFSTLHSDLGFVRIYKWEEDLYSWSKWGNDIPISEAAIHDYTILYDLFLAISLNENTVAVGISGEAEEFNYYYYYKNTGEVGIYRWNESTESWQQIGNNIVGEDSNESFGESVSLSTDGTRVSIGNGCLTGTGDNSDGICIYEWNEDTSSWIQT